MTYKWLFYLQADISDDSLKHNQVLFTYALLFIACNTKVRATVQSFQNIRLDVQTVLSNTLDTF